jgi:TP901 family phage tail tape measure protein
VAEIQSNIQVNIDTTAALANLKNLQRQLANFNASFSKSSAAAVRAQAEFSTNLVNSINATGKFAAGIQTIQSATERFTDSLEKNKFSTREYFRYAAGSTKAFSKMFSSEFNTIQKVAEERVKDLQTQYINMGRDANGALKAIAVRPLTLDMDDLATKVAITSQKQQIFGQLLKQGSTNLLNFGKNTQWAGRQLMVGFTIPLTIFGSKAAQVFMDLETQAIRFKRVYGEMFTTQAETTKALNEVRKLAQEFTKYGVAVTDTMKMAADAAAQGKQGADLMAQVAEATRLAVLGQVEQQQALETTMSLQNAFGYSAEQLAGKINFLNAVENQTVVGIEDLTIAIPKAGPVVKQLGGDVEDLAFFLTAMKEGGINASEGANALKSGLASLINPTDKASGMLADLGINIKGIVEANKGDIKGTVIGFAQALDTLAPLERARAIEQLFGKFQFARLSTLFQNVTKDGGQAARTLDLTSKSVEELAILSERELGAVEDATGTKFKKSMENLKTAIAPIGEQFLKAVTPIAEFIGKILEKFNGLSDGVKSGISRLVLIVGAVGPVVLMTFGLLANGLANIIKLFAAVRNGFLGLGKNSNYLGNQTNYLTSEQQEAAAIAASLDQAHSKLIQTFTVERSAVAQLQEAYAQAALAAGRLQQSNPGFFMPRVAGGRGQYPTQPPGMRLARGIISVPGPKGAGDVVPAMLSPGESVIPVEQSKKYGPLIQGIIADNIPGYAVGLSGTEQSHFGRLKPENIVRTIADPEMQQVMSAMGDFKIAVEVLGNGVDGLIEVVDFAEVNIKDLAKTIKENNIDVAYGSSRNPYEYGATGVRESKDRNRMYEAAGIAGAPLSYEELVKSGNVANAYAADPTRPEAKRKEAATFYQESVDMQKQIAGLSEDEKEKVKLDYSRQQHARAIAQKLTANGMQSQEAIIKSQKMIADAEAQVSRLVSERKTLAEKRTVLEKAHTATLFKLTPKLIGFDTTKERTLDNGGIFTRGQNAHAARDLAALNAGFGRVYGAGEQIPSEATSFGGSRIQQQRGARLRRKTSAFFRMGEVGGSLQDRSVIDPYMEARAKYFDKADPKINSLAAQSGAQIGKNLVQGTIQGANDEGQMASPSRRTYRQGQDLVRGMVNGITDESKRSSRQLKNTTVGANPLPMTRSGAAGGLQPAPKANLPQYTRDGIRIVPVGTTAPTVADQQDAQLADAERQRRRTILARTNGLLFGLSSLSSVLGMMGNGIAQKAAPFLVGINLATMAMQMIQGPASAAAVVITALVVGTYLLVERNKQQAIAQSKYIDTISATTEKMKSVGELTGKVGASQLMDKRRSMGVLNRYTTGFDRKGQQFGTTMMESEVGKQIYKGFTEELAKNRSGAVKQFGIQLGSYVADGVMSLEQAESFARSVGISLNDMTVSSQIVAELRELLGPNGENLLQTPLELRAKLIAQNIELGDTALEGLTSSIDKLGSGNQLKGLGKFYKTYVTQLFKETDIEKFAALSAAQNVQSLESVKSQIDGQTKMYEDKIKELEQQRAITKDKEKQAVIDQKIADLNEKKKNDTDVLRKSIKDVLDQQRTALKELQNAENMDIFGLDSFFASLNNQIETKFKATNEAGAKMFLDTSSNLLGTFEKLNPAKRKQAQELEVTLKTLVASDVLGLNAATNLLNMYGDDTGKMVQTLSTAFEINDSGQVSEAANIIFALLGDKKPEVAVKVFTDITSKKGQKDFEKRANFLAELTKYENKETMISMIIDDSGSLKKLDEFVALTEKIEQLPDPIQKSAVLDILTEGLDIKAGEQDDLMEFWDYIAKLPKEQQKTAIQTFITLQKTITSEEEIAAENKAIAAAGGNILPASAQQKIRDEVGTVKTAAERTKTIYGETGVLTKSKTGGKKTGKGDRDTTFDDMMKKLKLFQQASVNALGGFKELQRVMNLPSKKGGAFMSFNGITNQLVKTKNLSTDFIDMVEGLSPEELQKKFGKFGLVIKNGVVTFTKGAKDINKALASIAAGELVADNVKEMKKLEDRTAAVNILRAKGVDYSTAMAVTESNSIALAIKNGQLNQQQLSDLINSQRKRNVLEEQYQKIITVKQQDAVIGQKMANEQMLAFLELQNAIAENQFIIQKTEIETAAKRNGYTLELINYEEDLVNNVYEKQIQALDEIVKRNEEINRLQEGRFGIAEALARGDMAAAARAIQSVRQQEIQAQLEAKRKSIEEARKKTLEGITADGKTRKQIEEENAKNAAKLAQINLDTVKKQIEYAQAFTKAIGRTPEEVKAYNEITEKIAAIGGFKLDDQGVLKAIQDAVSGNPTALLSAVQKQIDKTVQVLFGGTVAEKQLKASQEDQYKAALGRYFGGIGAMPKPEDFGLSSDYGQALDTTPIGFNTTATTANTVAIEENTKAIKGGSGAASTTNKTTKVKSSGKGGKSSPSLKPENPRQADNKKQYVVTPDGAWREVPPKPKTPVVPKQAVDALGNELKRFPTVSGSAIDITVRPNPDDVAATVARINHEEMIARKQKEIEDQAKATAATQLAAAKAQEAAAARTADANNRLSPKLAEVVGIFQTTYSMLVQSGLAQSKKQDVADVANILNDKAASNAREAQIADKASLTLPQAIAAANESGRMADRVATAEIVAQKTAEANNNNLLSDKKLSNQMFDIYTGVIAQREGLNQKAYASDKKLSQDMLTIASNVKEQRTGLNQAAASADKKLSSDMFTIYNEVLAQRAGLNQAAYAADKKFSTTSVASGINKGSIREIEGAGPSKIDLAAAVKKQESAKATAIANINQPLVSAEERAKALFNSQYGPLAGVASKYLFKSMGGMVPKYFASGGYGRGTDIIPAMLTPGEFVVQKRAVDMLGTNAMNTINNGEIPGNSVYNYSLSVNVSNSNANPNDIARVVINQIKQIDSQRIRGSR